MANAFTYCWMNNDTVGSVRLQHLASNDFRESGVAPGDRIFCLAQRDRKLLLVAEMTVDEITDERGAEHFLNAPVGDGDKIDHCVCSSEHGSVISFEREIPDQIARQL